MGSQQPSVHQLYRRLQAVGKGSYGSVHKGVEIATGNVVALKIINLDDDDVDGIQHEVALLSQLRDAPNVTKYFGSYLDGPRLWIVMEFANGGSVYQLMRASPNGILDERHVVVLVREVLVGLAYLHRSGVIHRDIKSANVLVTATGKVMLCDFGVSALLATSASKRNTFIGTLNWMAPEVVQAVPNYDTKADIWSLGIMIYEMVKGSPPHANVSQERVIQLIPRAKPPRLIPGEGSKDLLDFIPLCLTEKPGDRLPAEELLKTKWIKAAAKVPVSTLKDLLLRYETWQKTSQDAADLAEPLPWEKDEADELGYVNVGEEENPWEFDTVRASRALDLAISPALSTDPASSSTASSAFSTVRATPASSKLPNSLRGLFDDASAPAPDPFRIPGFAAPTAPSHSPSPSPIAPPAPRRAATLAPRDRERDEFLDGPDLSKAAFAFPPRGAMRTVRPRASIDDDVPTLAAPAPDRPSSSSRGPSPAESMLASSSVFTSSSTAGADRAAPFYRAVRSARNVPDLAIPPPPSPRASPVSAVPHSDDASVVLSPESMTSAEAGLISLEDALISTTMRRVGTGIGTRNRSRTYASPPGFQFPPLSSAVSATPSSSSSGSTVRDRVSPSRISPTDARISPTDTRISPTDARISPTDTRISSTDTRTSSTDARISPTSTRISPTGARISPTHATVHSLHAPPLSLHATTHSLEMRRAPATALGRSRSALPETPAPLHGAGTGAGIGAGAGVGAGAGATGLGAGGVARRPSITRQASVAVMESVSTRPLAQRSGSSMAELTGAPGLRDVLKAPSLSSEHQLNMTDLLPPSPSAATTSMKPWAPSPSGLHTHYTPVLTAASSSNSSTTTEIPRSTSPLPLLSTSSSSSTMMPTPTTTSSSSTVTATPGALHARTHSATALALEPAAARPLDFAAIMGSHDATHAELARIVDDLGRWLAVAESGLSRLLERAGEDRIEEEDGEDGAGFGVVAALATG